MANTMAGKPFECALNPRMAHEHRYGELKRDIGKHKVLIVGGGPAGMMAAHTLALRGSDVTLYEKADCLGGAINLAKVPPLKERMQWLTDFYEYEFKRLGVTVCLNKEANAQDIEAAGADAVIIACLLYTSRCV